MKNPPTLIDRLYRLSFRNEPMEGIVSNAALRQALARARRFMLDDQMSTFLGELATASFMGAGSNAVRARLADQLRISAHAPHKTTWIEYNLRRTAMRTDEILQRPSPGETETPHREGWLIEQHPENSAAFRLHIFTGNSPEQADEHGFDTWGFPVVYSWTVNDEASPWRSICSPGSSPDSMIGCGVPGYDAGGRVTLTKSELLKDPTHLNEMAVHALVKEWVGVLRRVWALLATINDIPVIRQNVVQSRGFVARGRYRKFLDHTTLTLHVPQKTDLRKTARRLIAAARRRAHQVRAHWRKDWRHPGAVACTHEWEVINTDHHTCRLCGARRVKIDEHQRGDASLGFVTHDYSVTHENSEGGG